MQQLLGIMDAKPLANPFESETIVVQSRGMARWLSMQIANHQSIAANLDFPFPGSFLWSLCQQQITDLPEENGFEKSILLWKVLVQLPPLLENKHFVEIKHYLGEGIDEFKLFQLAEKIVDLYDQYMVYRPDWIMQWQQSEGDSEFWQAILWRAVVQHQPEDEQNSTHPAKHRAWVLEQFLSLSDDDKLNLDVLPERLFIFAIAALPPAHLDIFARLSEVIDVHIFIPNPCLHYWGDVITKKDIFRIKRMQKQYSATSLDHFSVGNSLLASMGKLGRDFQHQLHQYDCQDVELYQSIPRQNLLSYIQSDVLFLMDRADPLENNEESLFGQFDFSLTKRRQPIEADLSLQIHSCHSPLREIEVLHDQLLHVFKHNPDLKPADIVVMSPEIDTYAPLIRAVFAATHHSRYIPWSIADQSLSAEHDIIRSFFQLLGIKNSRFKLTEVLSLLATPAILKRYELDKNDLDKITLWCQKSGIRWAEDALARENLDLPATHNNTWEFGLERLMLGCALNEDNLSTHLYAGILPFNSGSSSEAALIGILHHFIDQLIHYKQLFEQQHNAQQWQAIMLSVMADFLHEDESQTQPLQIIRDLLISLGHNIQKAGYVGQFSLKVLTDYLNSHLTGVDLGNRFMTGQVTFCAMIPMRSIPFKVICLVGLNDQTYPRKQRPLGFDLMNQKLRLGDRSRRDDDRYLFLECLLSAKEVFYLSYTGRSIKDNSPMLASCLVSELCEYIDRNFCDENEQELRHRFSYEHPLQAFSQRYFNHQQASESSQPISYASEWLTCLTSQSLSSAFFEQALAPAHEDFRQVELENLILFFKNPVRFFIQRRLGIWLPEHKAREEDKEPFELGQLDTYQINQQLLSKALAGENLTDYYKVLEASGDLPYGELGAHEYAQLKHQVLQFKQQLSEKLSQPLPSLEVDLQLGDFRLEGWLNNIMPEGLLRFRYTRLKAEDQLSLWIQHLVLNTLCDEAKLNYPRTSLHVASKEIFQLNFVADAQQQLNHLLAIYWQGLSEPLSFFPKSTFTYIEALQKDKNSYEEQALLKAQRIWQGGYQVAGEMNSPYYQLIYSQQNPLLDDHFKSLAEQIYLPMFKAINR